MRKTWTSCTQTKFLLFVMNTTHKHMPTKYFCGTSPLVVIRYWGHSIGYICCVSLQFCLQLFFTVIEMKTKPAQMLDVMGLQILAEYGIPLEVPLIIMSKV